MVNFIQTGISYRVHHDSMELPLIVLFKGQTGETRGNRLLGAMEADSLARIEPHLEPIE
jgi:hypothetical protein